MSALSKWHHCSKVKIKYVNVIPKNNGDLMQVCSAETSPFIVAFTALFELEQVSKICRPNNSDI